MWFQTLYFPCIKYLFGALKVSDLWTSTVPINRKTCRWFLNFGIITLADASTHKTHIVGGKVWYNILKQNLPFYIKASSVSSLPLMCNIEPPQITRFPCSFGEYEIQKSA